jgi:hypothetical protein
MRARSVRRTHPGACRAPTLRARRPQVVAAPRTARPSAPDATCLAEFVLGTCGAHARDECVDRYIRRVITALQAEDPPRPMADA